MANPLLEVHQVSRQAEDRHQFGRRGNVKAGLPGNPLHEAAQSGDHVAQCPVVNVFDPLPDDPPRIQAEFITPHNVVVNQGRQGVISTGQGVQVTGKVEVDVLHRDNLAVTTASGTALNPKDGPHGWFPHCDDCLVAELVQGNNQLSFYNNYEFTGGGFRP